MSLETLDIALTIPDLWQQEAVRYLEGGYDVVVDAPTGAGKTYIFELVAKSGYLKGQAIYTVPTRALANDKLMEWRDKNWNVGIATGDIADNLDAPIIVATLETQKARLLRRENPALLVIDEYQMIADSSRGVNYEITLAITPPDTQLLLLSGSVQNPEKIVEWLNRIGRKAKLISHKERPVPQEEVYLEALNNRIPKSIYGTWPRHIAKALTADLGPILMFAPQRKESERIARQLAASFPLDDPLELTPEQKSLAGDKLAKLLKARVAYHHSGLSYKQRAGVIEPLAKAGQLRVVVATTGLGAGINFSMRSVIVTDRQYRQNLEQVQVRPDELLQMFGRAGRRGKDERGYVLIAPNIPRLEDAAPIKLKRTSQIDWPAFLTYMHQAQSHKQDPKKAANLLASHLFTDKPIDLGFKDAFALFDQTEPKKSTTEAKSGDAKDTIVEILTSHNRWERRKGPQSTTLGESLYYHREHWKKSIEVAEALDQFAFGTTSLIQSSKERIYGKDWVVAHFPKEDGQNKCELTKKYRAKVNKMLRNANNSNLIPRRWTIEELEKHLQTSIPQVTGGGKLVEIIERGGSVVARLRLDGVRILARKDSKGAYLFCPPERKVNNTYQKFTLAEHQNATQKSSNKSTIAETWQSLGLVDADAYPTRRGVLFSYFNHGEGLAVAAALEDPEYPVEEIVQDLANLRAGHRFDAMGEQGSRMTFVCREAYGSVTYPGYLKRGLPEEYGEGASDLVVKILDDPKYKYQIEDEDIKTGDVERILLEWRSIIRQIANAPEFPWDRWLELQHQARQNLSQSERSRNLFEFPRLTSRQKSRKPIPIKWR